MRAPTVLAFFLTGTLSSAHVPADPPGPDCGDVVPPPPPPPARTAPPACAVTEPAVWYKGKAEGCQYNPSTDVCIKDAILILPCGCKTATKVAQPVVTKCPQSEGQLNCQTGFMLTTTATNCP
ncbi:hypothetical protein EsDP_00001239 [Epichloe bromicola]|uniref:Uncharacterized protein n=1 Tax=Epichloe bromicola TaxID=79588 RepID=A0ABQ0CH92_9HYPO